MNKFPIIDSHMHIFDLEKTSLQWMEDDPDLFPSLRRSFSYEDYLKASKGYQVEKLVYLEVNVPFEDLDRENEEVLSYCTSPDTAIEAMVICGDLLSKDFESYIHRYAKNPYVKGVRRVLIFNDTPKGYCLQSEFVKNIQLLGKLGLSFDFCMRPEDLLDAVKLVELCPETRFVLDHMGNIGSKTSGKTYAIWKQAITELAKYGVYCKISGITEQIEGPWTVEDLKPNIQTCLELFGEKHIFFGSNWPVVNLNASFKEWIEAARSIIPKDLHSAFFYENAKRFYRLG